MRGGETIETQTDQKSHNVFQEEADARAAEMEGWWMRKGIYRYVRRIDKTLKTSDSHTHKPQPHKHAYTI